MSTDIPQQILDELTDVRLPRDIVLAEAREWQEVDGVRVPVYRYPAVVLGSGAAGLRAAGELKRRGVDVLVVTRKLFWGTSAFSGSDKQTLHTACAKHRGDDFTKMAQALGAGGAMDANVAYVEAVGSIDAFSGLKYLGLPLPQDRYGAVAVLRYQTDHDEFGRATSCGPRTSRLMVKVLAEEAIRLGIHFLDHSTAMSLLKSGSGADKKASGLVVLNRTNHDNAYGLSVVLSPNVVLASGGPGELYRDSVYPKNCFGSLGLALEAGLELSNLTEHQFGIGTRRTEFPWNLSGTYVQVMPYVYSTDADGNEYNFLADYYRTTQELVSNVFRKGYQWPFHASRTLDYGSSLVDPRDAQGTHGMARLPAQPAAGPRRPAVLARTPRRRRARLAGKQQRPARHADRPPAAHEPAGHRALPAIPQGHRARATAVQRQPPAHERRHRRRHPRALQPRRLLRGRRNRRHARRHARRRTPKAPARPMTMCCARRSPG